MTPAYHGRPMHCAKPMSPHQYHHIPDLGVHVVRYRCRCGKILPMSFNDEGELVAHRDHREVVDVSRPYHCGSPMLVLQHHYQKRTKSYCVRYRCRCGKIVTKKQTGDSH